jgi:hypothetical protein
LQHGQSHPFFWYLLSVTGSSFTGADIAMLMNAPADCFEYIAVSSSIDLALDMNLTIRTHRDAYLLRCNPLKIYNLIGCP